MVRIIYIFCVVALFLFHLIDAIDSNLIVKLHNDVREKIRQGTVPGQPKGVKLVNMQWDNNLANLALKHAKECVFAHDKPQDSRFYVGQNIYVAGSTVNKPNEDWRAAVNSWYNEYKVYKYSNQFNAAAGHYTQLVWANTKYVGCGYAYCPNKKPYQHYYVCNYGPGGNIQGQYPYKTA